MQASASRRDGRSKGQQEEATSRHPPKMALKPRAQPHPLELLIGDVVINGRGHVVSPKHFAVDEGVIGLYFAAHWCPPCRNFCPTLIFLYEELRKKQQDFFEVIYVSMDNKEDSFRDYLTRMPWYAVPFRDEEKREEIAMTFGIKGIPVLVLLDAGTLEVIAFNGRDIVNRDPRGALFPWRNLPPDAGKQSMASSRGMSHSSGKTGSSRGHRRSSNERHKRGHHHGGNHGAAGHSEQQQQQTQQQADDRAAGKSVVAQPAARASTTSVEEE